MANSGSITSGPASSSWYNRTITLSWSVKSQSIANNSTTISWSLKGSGGATNNWVQSGNFKVVIDGQQRYFSSTRINLWNGTAVASGEVTLYHNNYGDRSFSAYIEAGIGTYAVNQTADGSWSLPRIPRYATVNQSLKSKTETSITMSWSSDSTIDYIWYSSNNGSSWTGLDVTDGSSGSYTISGLSANTAYNIKTRVRRKDSQLTTDSSALSVTTYAYPYANSMPNFTIGNNLTIGFYNPLGRSIKIYMIAADNSEKGGDTITGTSITGYSNASWKTFLYASIPNAKSGTYKIRVEYGSQSQTRTGGTYTVNTSECSPTIGSVTYQDTNSTTTSITQNNQLIVQKNSIVRYTASSLAAKNSASISSCKVTVNGNNYNMTISGSTATGGNVTIDSSSNVTATVTLTDSRGLTSTKSVTVQMLAWSLPTAIITMQRHSNYYSDTDITVDASYSSVNSKNALWIWLRYKKTTESTWSSYISMTNNVMQTFTLDNNYAWNVQVSIDDRFGNTTYNLTLNRGMPIIYFDRLKSSTGFNCFPQNEQSVEILGLDVYKALHGEVLFTNDNGEAGTVTLSGSAANYAYIEIFYCDNNKNGYSSTKVYAPNGKDVDLSIIEGTANSNTLIRRTSYAISGTSITPDTSRDGYVQISGTTVSTLGIGTNYLRIVKVIGHLV